MNFNFTNSTLEGGGVQPQEQHLAEDSMTLNMATNNGVTSDDPGVIEVMASPESDGAFTEEMINQIISMLQNEGQITAETHTVIVHTPGGTMLRVQIQQVDGADLEQANTQELSNNEANAPNAMVSEQQDQLVYLGQSADELQENAMQQQFLNNNQMLQNGSAITTPQQQQYLTMEQPNLSVASNSMMGSFSNSNAITSDSSMPASLMSDVAEQVLQAANIIDSGGFRTTASNDVMMHQPVMNGVNMHTTSLNNGVVLSYEQPKLGSETVYQNQQPVSISNNISQHHSRPNSVNKIKQNRKYNSQQSDNGAHRSRQNNKSSIVSKRKPVNVTHTVTSEIVRIKIDTGYCLTNRNPICLDDDVIRIQTNTGHVKPRTPKFFRCTTCSIHFVTEQSLLQHINHGCMGNKKKTSYECTYCLAKFPSKSKTMDHLKLCSKRSQMKTKRTQHLNSMQSKTNRTKSSNPSKAVEVEIDSDGDEINVQHQEKTIIYDDDEDMDIDLGGDNEDYDTTVGKVSQKHLGPILKGGKFQCRDCDRTFAKDSQYKRHEGVCTNAPLNTSRIDITSVPEKKRGRPPKKVSVGDGTKTPLKPKLSSVGEPNKKKVTTNHEESSELYDMIPLRKSYTKKKDPEDIMDMLDTNLQSNMIDGGRSLSESFLQCLDGNEGEKVPTPVKSKPTVCGLCICHMESTDALIDHIKTTHGKDIVNMHAILTNNTDLRTFKCSLCPLHFISSEAVNNHLVAHHNEKMQDRLKSLQANSLDIPCPLCPDKLMTTELFQQHLAIEHTKHFPQTALLPAMKPEELDVKSSKAAQLTSQSNASDPWLTGRLCMQCGEACSNEEQLQLHSKDCKEVKQEKHHCYIKGCNPQGYESLVDLVAHVEQEHCHSSDGERKVFPNYQFFSTWLLQEIQRSGNKYSMVCSSVRSGCTYSTYLCPQYSTLKEQLPIHRCVSRLHVRTKWCSSKFDYSGRTEVVYFKTHKHEAVKEQSVDKVLKSSKRLKSLYVSVEKLADEEVAESVKESSPDPEITIKKSLAPARDTTTIITNGKDTPKPAKKLTDAANRVKDSITSVLEAPSKKRRMREELEESESEVVNKKKRMREELEEESEVAPPVNKKRRMKEEVEEESEAKETKTPNKKPRLNNNISSEAKKQPGKRGRPPTVNGPPKKQKAPEPEENETTYVLPANISEWGKLFEMVKSQMDAGTLSNNRAGSTEAKGLLKNQSKITSMALEEQVRIFNRLCILANIQVD